MHHERARLIHRLKRLRARVQIDLNTIDYWNEYVRKPHEEPIARDPGGDMERLIACIDTVLANDPGRGPVAPLNWQRSN